MTDAPFITAGEVKRITARRLAVEDQTLALCHALAEWALANDGKQLTKRNTPDGWHVRREYGMCHLEHEDYWRARHQNASREEADERPGASLAILVAHQETSVFIDAERVIGGLGIESRAARQDRRRALLADAKQLRLVASTLLRASEALARVSDVLPNGPDCPVPDRYEVIRAAGLGEVRLYNGRVSL